LAWSEVLRGTEGVIPDNQDAYYIEVRDRQGLTRAGYLVFGSYWWPWPFSRKVRVEWD